MYNEIEYQNKTKFELSETEMLECEMSEVELSEIEMSCTQAFQFNKIACISEIYNTFCKQSNDTVNLVYYHTGSIS